VEVWHIQSKYPIFPTHSASDEANRMGVGTVGWYRVSASVTTILTAGSYICIIIEQLCTFVQSCSVTDYSKYLNHWSLAISTTAKYTASKYSSRLQKCRILTLSAIPRATIIIITSVGTAIPVPTVIGVIPRAQLYLCMPFTAIPLAALVVQRAACLLWCHMLVGSIPCSR